MTHLITERQQLILDCIRIYIEQTGYSPSVRDLAQMCDIKSPQGILRHLKALEDKGFIQRDSKARSIRILSPQSKAEVTPIFKRSSSPLRLEDQSSYSDTELLPVVGQVAAGLPIAAIQDIEDRLPVSKMLLPQGRDSFLLRVKGDSMKEGIQPHDLILVTPGLDVHRSDIVVALIGDEATVKRYYPERDRVILRADNPAYDDIVISCDLRLIGKVTGLIRQY